MLKKTYILLLTFLFISCASKIKSTESIIIPFTLNSHNQILIETQVILSGSESPYTLNSLFDTGCQSDFLELTKTGAIKIYKDYLTEVENKQFDFFKQALLKESQKNQTTLTEEDIKKAFIKDGQNIHSTTPVTSCNTGAFYSSAIKKISYSPNSKLDEEDAVIGYKFFNGAKNIIINYKENYIEINGAPINNNPIPLYFFKPTEKFFIPITINGQKDYGIVDTGDETWSIRHENVDKQMVNNLLAKPTKKKILEAFNVLTATTFEDTPPDSFGTIESLLIGNVENNNFKYSLATNTNQVFTSDFTKKLILCTNNLGYPIFENKIIQLDFKKKLFYIED